MVQSKVGSTAPLMVEKLVDTARYLGRMRVVLKADARADSKEYLRAGMIDVWMVSLTVSVKAAEKVGSTVVLTAGSTVDEKATS